MDREQSPAYGVLRASSRRLLRFIEYEIARNGGRPVMLYNDQFAVVGSVRVIPPGLSELHALGLIEVTRYPKRHMCAPSERWRDIASKQDALIISARARTQRMPPMMVPSQPATASTNALLKERSWFDVPLVYANQRRATIAIEKGAPGERAFKDALTAWGEDYPTASTDAQTRVQSFERTAASDARTSVQTYYSLTPDCNQSGTITVRVLKQPSQGTLEIARDRGFTNYAADNIRAKCNAQEVELTRVWYKSNADFKGRDQAQLEAFFTSGTSIKTTLQITVK